MPVAAAAATLRQAAGNNEQHAARRRLDNPGRVLRVAVVIVAAFLANSFCRFNLCQESFGVQGKIGNYLQSEFPFCLPIIKCNIYISTETNE